ncbi:MAG: metallophosphoesterase [Caulobacteraceae bacterium]|nr:metallophosphoesterase [Caulobacteraceae bacterium]
MAKHPRNSHDDPADPSTPARRVLDGPTYSQPQPTPDPTRFKIKHPSDDDAYKLIDKLNEEHKLHALPFPAPRGGSDEPQITLEHVFGGHADAIATIQKAGQIVFHSTGDCGSTRGPRTENEVTDKMIGDFDEADPRELPQFCLLLGDIVYNFGETEYYYDQFYEPYRNYHAPVLAAAGNHDGMISPLAHAKSLDAYLRNFCSDPADGFVVTPEAGGLSRTAQVQPGVFFTFDAPFVRILVFYSNTLEDPGVISDGAIGDSQLTFLEAALQRVKDEDFKGALLFAHHHPPYAIGGQHSSSTDMRAQMDKVCEKVGIWPHAVLAGHAHSYQRFTRARSDGTEIPYIICGNGGHNVQKLHAQKGVALRTPQVISTDDGDQVTFENYDDQDYGYLRVIVDPHQLRIEYHPASDGRTAKTPDDNVTVDLASRKRTTYTPNDLGYPQEAAQIASQAGDDAHQGRWHRTRRHPS